MPAVELEPTGGVHRLLLQSPHSIVEAPAGNGDLFETLHRAGIVEQLRSRGVAQLQVQIGFLSERLGGWSRVWGLGFRAVRTPSGCGICGPGFGI